MKLNAAVASDAANSPDTKTFKEALQAARSEVQAAKADIKSARSAFRDLRASGASREARAEARGQIREARASASEARADLRTLRAGNNGGGSQPAAGPIGSGGPLGPDGVPTEGGPRLPVTVPEQTPAPSGNILGGTNALGATIDPVNADFTRNGGNEPIAELDVKYLGTTADGKARVEISQTNLSQENGTFLTPTFVGVHDGGFDVFNTGEKAPVYLERLAEDGTTDPIVDFFDKDTGGRGVSGIITGGEGAAGPLDPGETGSITLEIDPAEGRFLSFAQMVIPSNDAFVASGDDPRGIEIFDEHGNFVGGNVVIDGNDVYDAGTEVNTEEDAAFINQDAPDTGIDENGVVTQHPGFIGSERQSADTPSVPDQAPDAKVLAKVKALLALLQRY